MLSEETWGRVSSEGHVYSECPDALILEQLASEAAPPRALPTQPRFRSRPRLPRLPDPVPGPHCPPTAHVASAGLSCFCQCSRQSVANGLNPASSEGACGADGGFAFEKQISLQL